MPEPTTKQVDLKAYAAVKWYEIARLPAWFEFGSTRATAEYKAHGNVLEVANTAYWGPIPITVYGTAHVVGTGKLKVKFSCYGEGDYWILDTDCKSFSIVGSPDHQYLWILSNAPTMAATKYAKCVMIADQNGYNTWKLIKTLQE